MFVVNNSKYNYSCYKCFLFLLVEEGIKANIKSNKRMQIGSMRSIKGGGGSGGSNNGSSNNIAVRTTSSSNDSDRKQSADKTVFLP